MPSLAVINSAGAKLDGGKLVLTGVSANSIVFADRPVRAAGHVTTEQFIMQWDEGKDNFAIDPPNATVSVLGGDGSDVSDAVVTLKSPKLEGGNLTFDVTVLEGSLDGGSGPAALFIDHFGGGFGGGGFRGGGFAEAAGALREADSVAVTLLQEVSMEVSPMSVTSMLPMSAGPTGMPRSTTEPGMAAVRLQRERWQVRPSGRRQQIPTITRNAAIIRFHRAIESHAKVEPLRRGELRGLACFRPQKCMTTPKIGPCWTMSMTKPSLL